MNEPSHRDITRRALGGEVKTGVGLTGQRVDFVYRGVVDLSSGPLVGLRTSNSLLGIGEGEETRPNDSWQLYTWHMETQN